MDAIAGHITKEGLRGYNSQNIANTIWAFATLRFFSGELISAITHYIKGNGLKDFNDQGIANLAWAFARLSVLDDAAFVYILQSRGSIKHFSPQNRHKMQQFILHIRRHQEALPRTIGCLDQTSF